MTVTSRSLAALALGLVFAQTASAEGTSRPLNDAARAMGEAIALDIDADGDGVLTPREVAAASREVFASIDDDGDRQITPVEMHGWRNGFDEIAAFRGGAPSHGTAIAIAFDLFDRDDDERVSPRELGRALAASAASADADGRLTVGEFREGFILNVLILNALAEPAA
jgi:hypothetical protein